MLHNPKYEPDTFRELTKGDIRNCRGDAVLRRLEKIVEQYEYDMHYRGEEVQSRDVDEDEDDTSDDEED
jgi:hypothetical protein